MGQFEMEIFLEPDRDGHRYLFTPIQEDNRDDAVWAWCVEQFGEAPEGPTGDPKVIGSRWIGSTYFFFRDADDALQFRLRWC